MLEIDFEIHVNVCFTGYFLKATDTSIAWSLYATYRRISLCKSRRSHLKILAWKIKWYEILSNGYSTELSCTERRTNIIERHRVHEQLVLLYAAFSQHWHHLEIGCSGDRKMETKWNGCRQNENILHRPEDRLSKKGREVHKLLEGSELILLQPKIVYLLQLS